MKNKELVIIWSIVLVLSISFGLSFITNSKRENRKSIKTTLLNPKYINQVKEFTITQNNHQLILSKNSMGIWEVITEENSSYKLLADQNKVENLVQNLSTIINMYKISDNLSKNSNFGLLNSSETSIFLNYLLENGTSTTLEFGDYDFSEAYRYMTNDSKTVYEVPVSLDKFLSCSVQSWSDPLIISENLINKNSVNDVQRVILESLNSKEIIYPYDSESSKEFINTIFDLRQGGIPSLQTEIQNKDFSLTFEFGDKSILLMEIYNTNIPNEFLLKEKYIDSKNQESEYTMKISSWTYNKINTKRL